MTAMATHGVHRGPRSPLVIDITRLGRRPGSMKTLQETVPAPDRIGIPLIGITQGTPLELDVKLESVSEGVLVTGTVSAATTGECARCLTPVTGHVDVDITELFAYEGSDTEATTADDEVGHVVTDRDGDGIDLEQTIVDAVGMALPFSPLCRDDCPGLCPECGTPLASAEPDHHHDAIDPRWAKLSTIMPTEQESDGSAAPS
jgi:uncharacterized protein